MHCPLYVICEVTFCRLVFFFRWHFPMLSRLLIQLPCIWTYPQGPPCPALGCYAVFAGVFHYTMLPRLTYDLEPPASALPVLECCWGFRCEHTCLICFLFETGSGLEHTI